MSNAISVEKQLADLSAKVDALATERDEYRKLYLETLELCRKLEQGILGQKRERLSADDSQLTLSMLGMLLGNKAKGEPAEPAPALQQVRAHERKPPTGRKPLPENLPRVDVEVFPPEVQQQGLDAFERIGEDVTETDARPAQVQFASR